MSTGRRRKRTGLPEEVAFPVTPFLDMAFQLLAFFILTFRPPSRETRLDLYLPTAPAALPVVGRGRVIAPNPEDSDLDTDLVVTAESDPRGGISGLKLGNAPIRDATELEARLRTYAGLLDQRGLRIRFLAPDALRYEEAAKIIGACSAAGASSILLAEPKEPSR